MKWGVVSLVSFDLNSEKMTRIYKAGYYINDITFGASLFVFCDLNTNFQL